MKGYGALRLLGVGGFGAVWEGAFEASRAAVAIKVGRADSALVIERFRREAEALLRVGAPHAPELHEHGQLDDGRPYIVMERIAGETLAALLERVSKPPPALRASAIADAVLAAVEAAHARGVVHRDLKPENIFVDEAAGRATLIDFGLARGAGGAAEEPLTRAGSAVGTIEYVAPEQLRGDPEQDARADVYALGAILYELFTLRPPFVGDAAAIEYGHLTLRPRRPGEIAPVPAPIERVVLDCLAKDPARRVASVTALRRALTEASSQSAGEGAPAGEPVSSARAPMIAEGRRPAVLLAAETAAPTASVLGVIEGRRGLVVRQRGRRYVALFSGSEADAPVEAALRAARELAEHPGARAALHLTPVLVRPRPDGAPAVYGAAVDRPETWIPTGEWTGVAWTPEVARAMPSIERAEDAPDRALFGREAALAALGGSLERALSGRPVLVTVLGDHGLGKTRIAAEAAARFERACPGGRLVALRAEQAAAEDVDRTSRELLARLSAASDDISPHRLDRARAITAALRERAREGPLALVLDDAHLIDDAALDALELATLEGPSALWIVVAAHPRLEDARRGWGGRAEHHERIVLDALAPSSGRELAAALLAPAEYPPAAALEELCGWAGGNPGCLVEIARALKDAGIVRRRGEAGSFYLATSEISRVPASTAWQWLAARKLDAIPPELSACVRLCAVLGAFFSRDEVEQVQAELDRSGAASTPIDAGVGLRALASRGIFVQHSDERFSFQSAVLADAVYAMLDSAHRARVHRAAYDHWRAELLAPRGSDSIDPLDALARLARHAAASGEREEAAAAYLELGDRERARHRDVAADARYSAALEHLDPMFAGARARALTGRAKVRYRLLRTREALDDLAAARALAEPIDDRAQLADVLIEESNALDWENDFDGSEARVRAARPIVEQLGDAALTARLLVAEGRSVWRHGRAQEAVDLLGRGAAAAEAVGDYDARVVALMLLVCALVVAGHLDEAEARFDEVIALATEARDGVHLCGAYVNRFFLWSAKKDLARAIADARRAMELAREIGNPLGERGAAGNLAELLFWCGRDDEALTYACRACALEDRFFPRPVYEGHLLLARIHAGRGEYDVAAALVAWIDERCPPDASAPSAHVLLGALRLLVAGGGAPEAWDALFSGASALVAVERLELLFWRARAAAELGRRDEARRARAEAEALLDESPAFRDRFAALGELS